MCGASPAHHGLAWDLAGSSARHFSITPPKVGRANAQGSQSPLSKLIAAQRYAGLDIEEGPFPWGPLSVPLTIVGLGCDLDPFIASHLRLVLFTGIDQIT